MVVHVLPMHRRDGTLAGMAVVDPEDFRWASRWRWSLHAKGYAQRMVSEHGKKRLELLHRAILGLTPGDGRFGDHRDGNRLDCRRANLRVVTPGESTQNVSGRGHSRHRGVDWHKRDKRWRARVKMHGRTYHLGNFEREEDAAAVASAFRAQHMPFAVDR